MPVEAARAGGSHGAHGRVECGACECARARVWVRGLMWCGAGSAGLCGAVMRVAREWVWAGRGGVTALVERVGRCGCVWSVGKVHVYGRVGGLTGQGGEASRGRHGVLLPGQRLLGGWQGTERGALACMAYCRRLLVR